MKPKILLVDDRPENLFALKQVLSLLEVETVAATSGNEALRATLANDFALAILDVQMPGMDGYELAALIRGDKKTRNIPIIFLTAVYSDSDHVSSGYESGAVDFITKPFVPEILLSKVKVFLELFEQRQQLQASIEQQYRANAQLQTEIERRTVLEAALKEAKDAAEAASQSKSAFLASMSHEIRTPINGVLGMLQLLQTTELDHEQSRYTNICTDAAKTLLRLINDILDLSRIEAGKFDLAPEEISVVELVENLVAIFREPAGAKGIELTHALDMAPDTRVMADAGCLRQILFNLLGNALKFTAQGSIHVHARIGQSASGRLMLRLCVEDSGCGIPEAMQPLVFDLFTQAHTGANHRRKGAGLGLGIVQRLVELMGGRVLLCSSVGKGTTIFFEIAVEEVLAPMSRPGLPAQTQEPLVSPWPVALSVLLAEDDPVNRITAQSMLKKMGHKVLHAPDGKVALELLATHDFDLILMDVNMPEMDGIEATHYIRESGEFGAKSTIPIIALTAHAMKGDRERLLAAGMSGYLSKPIYMEELKNVIARVMERQHRAQDTHENIPR